MDRSWSTGNEDGRFLVIEIQRLKVLNAGRRSDEELFRLDELFAVVGGLYDETHSVVLVAFCGDDATAEKNILLDSCVCLLIDLGIRA